jgi:hypothetical protein
MKYAIILYMVFYCSNSMIGSKDMAECSLCGNFMKPGGGAVLFTDTHGIPFEVCGECEMRFEVLQTSRSQPEAEAALDYIANYANGIGREGAYHELMGFVGKEFPAAELEAEIAEIREAKQREIANRKPGMARRVGMSARRLLLMIVGLLLLASLIFLIYNIS